MFDATRLGYHRIMSSMGDLGRQFERMQDDPHPASPPTELDELEQRLDAFIAWGDRRSPEEIRRRFAEDFRARGVVENGALDEDAVFAISEGRGREVRSSVSDLLNRS
jgi:hypothetical protein